MPFRLDKTNLLKTYKITDYKNTKRTKSSLRKKLVGFETFQCNNKI